MSRATARASGPPSGPSPSAQTTERLRPSEAMKAFVVPVFPLDPENHPSASARASTTTARITTNGATR